MPRKIVQEMIKKSATIHAACLFHPIGAPLRKILCMLLSGTKPSNLYADWEDFANLLNLEGHLIQVITREIFLKCASNSVSSTLSIFAIMKTPYQTSYLLMHKKIPPLLQM